MLPENFRHLIKVEESFHLLHSEKNTLEKRGAVLGIDMLPCNLGHIMKVEKSFCFRPPLGGGGADILTH
jgi:hypothetical protein